MEAPFPVVGVITIGAYVNLICLIVPIQYATTVASIEYGTFPFRESIIIEGSCVRGISTMPEI